MTKNPEHYALVIGIDGYSQLPALQSAGADAKRFALWLQSDTGGGLSRNHIQLLLSAPTAPDNPFAAGPSQADVDQALEKIVQTNRKSQIERLYFYFSGHSYGPSFDDVGMLMANASMSRPYSVRLREYRQFLRQSGHFPEIVFVLDCSRVNLTGGAPAPAPSLALPPSQQSSGSNDFILMASSHGEPAFEVTDAEEGGRRGFLTTAAQPLIPGTKERRGLLTQAILEGLQQPELADGLGRFTSSSLSYYLKTRMPELAAEADVNQTPSIETTLKNEIIFSTIPLSELGLVPVQIIAPPGLKGDLVLLDSFANEILRMPAANSIGPAGWAINLVRNRWYQLKLVPGLPNPKPNLIDLTEPNGNPHVFNFKP